MSIGAVYERILVLLAIIAGLLVVLLVVLTGGEALLRIFNLGLVRGSVEFSEYALFTLAMLAAPWLLYHDKHLRVTVVLDSLGSKAHARVVFLTDLIGLAATAVAVRYSVEVFVQSYIGGQLIFNNVVIKDWLLQWQVPLALGFLLVEFLRRIWVRVGTPAGRATLADGDDHA